MLSQSNLMHHENRKVSGAITIHWKKRAEGVQEDFTEKTFYRKAFEKGS